MLAESQLSASDSSSNRGKESRLREPRWGYVYAKNALNEVSWSAILSTLSRSIVSSRFSRIFFFLPLTRINGGTNLALWLLQFLRRSLWILLWHSWGIYQNFDLLIWNSRGGKFLKNLWFSEDHAIISSGSCLNHNHVDLMVIKCLQHSNNKLDSNNRVNKNKKLNRWTNDRHR